MLYRCSIGAIAQAGALAMTLAAAQAQVLDFSKYPDIVAQWRRPAGIGIQWDQSKRVGRAQQAPLTPEYQALYEANLADQAAGGPRLGTCVGRRKSRFFQARGPV